MAEAVVTIVRHVAEMTSKLVYSPLILDPTVAFCFSYSHPTQTRWRVIVENLSSRVSWQVRQSFFDCSPPGSILERFLSLRSVAETRMSHAQFSEDCC